MGQIMKDHQHKKDQRRRRKKPGKAKTSWSDVDVKLIKDLLQFAEDVDGAVRFGRSRDGSVLSLGFLIGDERFTEWIRGGTATTDELCDLLDELASDYDLTDATP